jgi:hypothetical protein
LFVASGNEISPFGRNDKKGGRNEKNDIKIRKGQSEWEKHVEMTIKVITTLSRNKESIKEFKPDRRAGIQ